MTNGLVPDDRSFRVGFERAPTSAEQERGVVAVYQVKAGNLFILGCHLVQTENSDDPQFKLPPGVTLDNDSLAYLQALTLADWYGLGDDLRKLSAADYLNSIEIELGLLGKDIENDDNYRAVERLWHIRQLVELAKGHLLGSATHATGGR